MKLHKILMRHTGPKSSVDFTLLSVLADSDQQILARLDAQVGDYTYGAWAERDEPVEIEDRDSDARYDQAGVKLHEIYDETFEVVGTETTIEKMLRLRGEAFDSDANFEDAYYGIKHYGWTEGVEITQAEYDVLSRFARCEDWRQVVR